MPKSHWGAPPPSEPQEPAPSPMAVVSLVTGVAGVVCLGLFLPSIVAAVAGYLARQEIDGEPDRYTGRSLATWGMVLGLVGILLGVLWWSAVATGILHLPHLGTRR
ncbi:MAG: DUF4190 domain-containing protein [Actinomycetota bacterium]|nr:DUF4190 domain-containing protein [Actinomycetota bacterium]